MALLSLATLTAGVGVELAAQSVEPVDAIKPLRGVRSAMGVSYPENSDIDVEFQGTTRLPTARGKAEVERKAGLTRITLKVDDMKPARAFGGDLATYVLWTVAPEGHVDNVGEVILDKEDAKAKATTPLQTFGMFVAAEPHSLVDTPSQYVVLETSRPKDNITGQMLKGANLKYKGFDGIYQVQRETLHQALKAEGEERTDMKQARVSVELAKRAGAEKFAGEELAQAEASLQRMINAVEANVSPQQTMVIGHETVRKAVEAQKLAEERAFQAALDAEREENATRIQSLRVSIEQAQSDAERARLEAQQREMELKMETEARQNALEDARQAAERARLAEEQANQAQQEARLAAMRAEREAEARTMAESQAAAARLEVEQARAEQARIRERMENALSAVVETRETARGLIVNLPDILFDFDKATLKPDAREKLSKVCGILLVSPGYTLAIEGHTDSVGADAYNQKLSENRASSVYDYLGECSIPREEMTTTGFGESKPIATNDTADGRQQNRRVEIVIEESKALEDKLSAVVDE